MLLVSVGVFDDVRLFLVDVGARRFRSSIVKSERFRNPKGDRVVKQTCRRRWGLNTGLLGERIAMDD